jgi:GNAT superfamily N-acetyltransferase
VLFGGGLTEPHELVAWRTGGTLDHSHLRTFVCTDHAEVGSEPWSEDVERWFNDELNLPGVRRVRDVEFHCGYLAKVLVAVATWRPDHEPHEANLGRHWYLVPAIGIAWGLRRKGGRLADAALERVLRAIDRHALEWGAAEVIVFAKVHKENVPATFLFESKGFERFPPLDSGALRGWLITWPGQTLDQ